MATETKMFNIRISVDKHKRFKEFAEEQGKSMGGILLHYIDELLDGDQEIVGMEDGRITARIEDPAAMIRDQYKKGVDF
jgi:hypothetical protein